MNEHVFDYVMLMLLAFTLPIWLYLIQHVPAPQAPYFALLGLYSCVFVTCFIRVLKGLLK